MRQEEILREHGHRGVEAVRAIIAEIPDGNDHSIDAVRYACMDDALRGA